MSKHRTATVSWKPVTEATGYKIFWGTQSHFYSTNRDVGNAHSTQITGLRRGTTYYFAGKSYNAVGNSPFSVEVVCKA